MSKGLFVNKLAISGPESGNFHFTRRFNDHLNELGGLIGAELQVPKPRSEEAKVSNLEMS